MCYVFHVGHILISMLYQIPGSPPTHKVSYLQNLFHFRKIKLSYLMMKMTVTFTERCVDYLQGKSDIEFTLVVTPSLLQRRARSASGRDVISVFNDC